MEITVFLLDDAFRKELEQCFYIEYSQEGNKWKEIMIPLRFKFEDYVGKIKKTI